MIGVQDSMETAIWGLRNYVRNSKERLLIAARTIEEDRDEKHQLNKKRGKRMKGKHSGHKNNYMGNLSDKKWVRQVKIGGDG